MTGGKLPPQAEGTYVNLDGELVHASEATVSLWDRNFLYSDGVFESIPVVDRKILLFDRHVDRLYRSTRAMKIRYRLSREELLARVVETIQASEVRTGMVRIVVSRGVGPQGLVFTDQVTDPLTYIMVQDLSNQASPYGNVTISRARIVSTTAARPDVLDARIKSTSYVNNVLAERELVGTDDEYAIMLDEHGHVAEAHVANILILYDETTIATPPTTYTLAGVTRETLLEIAESDGFTVRISPLTPYDLYTSDDVILCSSRLFAMVTSLNGHPLREQPSAATTDLADTFFDYTLTHEYIGV